MGLSLRKYAVHRGLSLKAIQKAIQSGRIMREPDGTIDPVQADADWAHNTRVSAASPRRAALQESGANAQDVQPETQGVPDYHKAHAIRVMYEAKLAKLEVGIREGKLIGYRDAESGKHYEFLINHFRLAARTIADIYKDRWMIEIFFREIKQNLRIKSFIGHSENAVLIQIYTALTVYLLLAYQKFLSRFRMSIQQILQIMQLNLLGDDSMEILLNPRTCTNAKSYQFSLLDITP